MSQKMVRVEFTPDEMEYIGAAILFVRGEALGNVSATMEAAPRILQAEADGTVIPLLKKFIDATK